MVVHAWMVHFSRNNPVQNDYIMLIPGITFLIILWMVTLVPILLGYFVSKREKLVFSRVLAGILCVFIPFGTVVGVISSIALSKQPIKQEFSS